MIGLDTNVLLRYLAQEDPVQSPLATEFITRRLTEEEPDFVSLVTILEVVWVLKSLYKRPRKEIANDTFESPWSCVAWKSGSQLFIDSMRAVAYWGVP